MGNKQPLFDLRHKRWKSVWHSSKKDYAKNILVDSKIRNIIEKKSIKSGLKVSEVYIFGSFRDKNSAPRVDIHTSKPGAVLGKAGSNISSIKEDIYVDLKKVGVEYHSLEKMEIGPSLVKNQSLDARTIAREIADGLQKRKSYLYLMRTYADEAMRFGALGIRIVCSGRLNGAEIARTTPPLTRGRCPKNTIRENIFYAAETAFTDSGTCGTKVWINLPREQIRKKPNKPSFERSFRFNKPDQKEGKKTGFQTSNKEIVNE